VNWVEGCQRRGFKIRMKRKEVDIKGEVSRLQDLEMEYHKGGSSEQ